MIIESPDVHTALNNEVFTPPLPVAIEGLVDDPLVVDYLEYTYQRKFVINVLGNLIIGNNFSKEQLAVLRQNIGTKEGVSKLADRKCKAMLNMWI
jgi:hypothetical protein